MTQYLNHTLATFHRVCNPQQHPVSQEGSVGSCQPEVCVGVGLEDKRQPHGLNFMLSGHSWAQAITMHCPSPRHHGTSHCLPYTTDCGVVGTINSTVSASLG